MCTARKLFRVGERNETTGDVLLCSNQKKISNFCTFLFLDFHYSEKERKKPSIGLSSQLCWTSLANEWISLSPPRMQQVGGLSSVIFTCILVVCRGNYVCPVGERTRKDEITTFYQKKKHINRILLSYPTGCCRNRRLEFGARHFVPND